MVWYNALMKKGIDYIGVGVGALIINNEGKTFLAKRGKEVRNEKGLWEFPGGGVRFGDTVEDTIIREIKEEYGVDIEIIELLGVNNHIIPDEKQHWVSPCFICKIISGMPEILEPHKCDEIGWFTIEEASKMPISLVTQSNIKHLKEKYGDTLPKV